MTARPFGLPHKVNALAPGEFFILPDPNRSLDRQLISLRAKSPNMPPVKATRVQYIEGDRLLPGLKITRLP